jgi:hypothetical protein
MRGTGIGKLVGALVRLGAAGTLAVAMSACSAQPESAQTASANQVAMKFDLGQCQQTSPSLYKCPAVDKPLCDPGYNKADVICVKIDKTGVVLQQLQ